MLSTNILLGKFEKKWIIIVIAANETYALELRGVGMTDFSDPIFPIPNP